MATQQQQSQQSATATAQDVNFDFAALVDRWASAPMGAKYKAVDASLQQRIERVEELLPDPLKGQAPQRVKRAMLEWARKPRLQECTPESFIRCVLEAAELGLSIDGKLCHAVPFNNKVKGSDGVERWQLEAQCIPDYKGLIAVARRTGTIKDCFGDVVCVNDIFFAARSLHGDNLEHKRDITKPRGAVNAAYMVFVLPDNSRRYELMGLDELHHVRGKSKSFTGKKPSGPWVTDPNEMYKKTVVKRGLKMYAEDPAMMRALEIDDRDYEADEEEAPARPAAPPPGRYSLRGNGQPSQAVPSATNGNGPDSSASDTVDAFNHPYQAIGGAPGQPVQVSSPAPGGEERTPAPGPFEPEQLAMQDEIGRLRDHIGPVSDGATREAVEDEIKSADVSDQWKQTLLLELEARWKHVQAPFADKKQRQRRGADVI